MLLWWLWAGTALSAEWAALGVAHLRLMPRRTPVGVHALAAALADLPPLSINS